MNDPTSWFYERAAEIIRHIYDARLDGSPTLDLATYFPAGERFIAAWPALRDEAQMVVARLRDVPRFHEIMREQTAISDNDGRDWRMLIVKAYGTEFSRNKALCPTLAALVAEAPEVLSASISFLAPGKHIPPHRGPFRGVLRFYLGLAVPVLGDGRAAAVLNVADTQYRIGSGDHLLWDDTFTHEVWNESEEIRSVLLLDVWRRDMPVDMKLFSKILIAVVRAGIRIRSAAAIG